MNIQPCPFCGGEAERKRGYQNITFFVCHPCGSVVSFAKTKHEPPYPPEHATDKYNTRWEPAE